MIDPFERYEKKIAEQHARITQLEAQPCRLREACRNSQKGLDRLRRKCDSHRRKIVTLGAALAAATSAVRSLGGQPPTEWTEHVRRSSSFMRLAEVAPTDAALAAEVE